MRNIDKEVCENTWAQSLNDRDAIAWILIINTMCDDQGRFEINFRNLRYHVFRANEISDKEIEKVLNALAEEKKIVIYEVNDKKYCQVINWWKYQYELSDMEMSRFPAPEGWTDCWNHAHSFDGKSSQSGSWINRMKDGGFQKSNVRQ